MPLRPLASPLKIGVDICQIERIRQATLGYDVVQNEKGITHRRTPFRDLRGVSDSTNQVLRRMNIHLHPLFLNRLFREDEIQFFYRFWQRVQGKPDAHRRLFPHLAGRWAAKEAIIKVASPFYDLGRDDLGRERKLSLRDIIVWPTKSGRPQAAIIGQQRKEKMSTSASRIMTKDTTETDTDPFTSSYNGEATLSTSVEAQTMFVQPPEIDSVENKIVNLTNMLDHLDGDMVEIGISHEKDYAVATALFC